MVTKNGTALELPLFAEHAVSEVNQHQERHHDPDFDLHFLALSQLRGLGLNSIRALVERYPDLGTVWHEQPASISEILHQVRVPGSSALAEAIRSSQLRLMTEGRELQGYLAQRNIRVIAATDPEFPKQLRDLPGGPLWLFVEGQASILNAGTFVAVIGTREASDVGLKTAEQVTWLAAKAGFGLVSGLAEGIDAAAHSAAARNSVPQVGVLGTGINITFPRSTSSLRRQIIKTGGCVITEYLPNENYGRSQFVQRNRIQAGLSEVVCPVEGRASSGTMHTVRFAAKYERRLFGVTRGPAGAENEVPDVLANMDAPVFDLASPEGRAKLQTFLETIPGPRFPTPDHPNPEFSFRSVLKAIDTVTSYDEFTRDDKLHLLELVRQRLGLDDK